MLRLDHVVYVVPDLEDAAERWRRDLGLDSVDGGRHEPGLVLTGGPEGVAGVWIATTDGEREVGTGGWMAGR